MIAGRSEKSLKPDKIFTMTRAIEKRKKHIREREREREIGRAVSSRSSREGKRKREEIHVMNRHEKNREKW